MQDLSTQITCFTLTLSRICSELHSRWHSICRHAASRDEDESGERQHNTPAHQERRLSRPGQECVHQCQSASRRTCLWARHGTCSAIGKLRCSLSISKLTIEQSDSQELVQLVDRNDRAAKFFGRACRSRHAHLQTPNGHLPPPRESPGKDWKSANLKIKPIGGCQARKSKLEFGVERDGIRQTSYLHEAQLVFSRAHVQIMQTSQLAECMIEDVTEPAQDGYLLLEFETTGAAGYGLLAQVSDRMALSPHARRMATKDSDLSL